MAKRPRHQIQHLNQPQILHGQMLVPTGVRIVGKSFDDPVVGKRRNLLLKTAANRQEVEQGLQ